MRIIADRYEGVNPKERTMSVLFKALFDAMSDNQQCDTCPSGDCDPLTHRLPPSSLPPLDFVLGEDGMCRPAYDPQQTTGTDNQTQSTSQQPTGITPSSSLYRPSGVNNVEVRQNTTPLVDGVQQKQQAPPNVPALVVSSTTRDSRGSRLEWGRGELPVRRNETMRIHTSTKFIRCQILHKSIRLKVIQFLHLVINSPTKVRTSPLAVSYTHLRAHET